MTDPLSLKHKEYLMTAVEILNLIGEKDVGKRLNKVIADRELPANTVAEYRVGRNFIRVGDTVKIKPSKLGKRDGFLAVVKRIEEDGTMHVMGAPSGKVPSFRTFPLNRIQRVAQSRVQEKND